jgi:N4-gp56 family major capsid protein
MYLNSAEIREAISTLKSSDAPKFDDNTYVCVIHPDTEQDLFNDSNIQQAFQYAANRGPSNPLATGELGNYLGVKFVTTSNSATSAVGISLANGPADVYLTVMFGKGYVGEIGLSAMTSEIIYHEPGSSGSLNDPLSQVWSLGYKFAFAAARLDESRAVRIEHASTLGTI